MAFRLIRMFTKAAATEILLLPLLFMRDWETSQQDRYDKDVSCHSNAVIELFVAL